MLETESLICVRSILLIAIFTETADFFCQQRNCTNKIKLKKICLQHVLVNNTTMVTSREQSYWWKEAEIFLRVFASIKKINYFSVYIIVSVSFFQKNKIINSMHGYLFVKLIYEEDRI